MQTDNYKTSSDTFFLDDLIFKLKHMSIFQSLTLMHARLRFQTNHHEY